MDLNHFYSQHQIALMKAGAASTVRDRCGHVERANEIARHIGSFQAAQGAGASHSWRAVPCVAAAGVAL